MWSSFSSSTCSISLKSKLCILTALCTHQSCTTQLVTAIFLSRQSGANSLRCLIRWSFQSTQSCFKLTMQLKLAWNTRFSHSASWTMVRLQTGAMTLWLTLLMRISSLYSANTAKDSQWETRKEESGDHSGYEAAPSAQIHTMAIMMERSRKANFVKSDNKVNKCKHTQCY